MPSRGRISCLGGVLAVGIVAAVVLAARSAPSGCGYPNPVAVLPDALRVQGGFDQQFDAGDIRSLEDSSQVAATTLHKDLIGATAGPPVSVISVDSGHPDALVLPLTRTSSAAAAPRVVALAVYLRDCSGGLHYSTIDDLGSASLADFPVVSKITAQSALHGEVVLVYSADPTHPQWRAVHGSATLLPATQ